MVPVNYTLNILVFFFYTHWDCFDFTLSSHWVNILLHTTQTLLLVLGCSLIITSISWPVDGSNIPTNCEHVYFHWPLSFMIMEALPSQAWPSHRYWSRQVWILWATALWAAVRRPICRSILDPSFRGKAYPTSPSPSILSSHPGYLQHINGKAGVCLCVHVRQ